MSNIRHNSHQCKSEIKEELETIKGGAVSPACLLAHNSTEGITAKDKSVVLLYDKDVIVKKFRDEPPSKKGGGMRNNIFEFSESSKRRLLFVCRNSGHYIKSQVCLTYHKSSPINGKCFKETLNVFLQRLRRKYKNIHYLWVLEFQKNGQPHAHLFTDIEPTKENRILVATYWNEITNETEENLKFTSHPRNFFKWVMKSGSYLAKEYIAKTVQKDVPEHFQSVGRFWGASRNMTPKFSMIIPEKTVEEKYYKKAVRAVFKAHERKLKAVIGKRINLRKKHITKSLPLLASDFLEVLKYYWWYSKGNKAPLYAPEYQHLIPSFELGVPF